MYPELHDVGTSWTIVMWKAFAILVLIPAALVAAGWVMLRAYGHSSLGSIKKMRIQATENKKIEDELKSLTRDERILVGYGDKERDLFVTGVDLRRKEIHAWNPNTKNMEQVPFKDVREILY